MNFISTKTFLKALDPNKKYCFILGAGASVSSGIPAAKALADKWLQEIMNCVQDPSDYTSEIERRIRAINSGKNYDRFKNSSYEPDLYASLDDYSRICELRFLNNRNEEYEYIFNLMNQKLPFIGYLALANILTQTESKQVITTNFDELVETAVNYYTDEKVVVINHENLADYSTESFTNRCKVLKLHHDICTGGLNREEELEKLNSNWSQPLDDILNDYTPIVIGYAGTDKTLMPFLCSNITNGIYWCHRCGEIPHQGVVDLVEAKNGKLVEIIDFDQIMLLIASILTEDDTYKRQIYFNKKADELDRVSGYCGYKMRLAVKALRRKGLNDKIVNLYQNRLKNTVQPFSNRGMLLCEIGAIQNSIGCYQKAAESFLKAFNHEQEKGRYYYKARYSYAVAVDKKCGPEKAKPIYKELADFDPAKVIDIGGKMLISNALNNFCRSLIASKEYSEAKKYAEKLASMRRYDGGVYSCDAATAYFLNDADAAMRAFDNAVICYDNENDLGNKARALLQRGMLYYKHGKIDNAKADLRGAIANTQPGYAVHTLAERYLNEIETEQPISNERIDAIMDYRAGKLYY